MATAKETLTPIRNAFTVVGIGTIVSLAIGVAFGLVIGDIPRGVGQVAPIGLLITAVVGVIVALLPSRSRG